MNLTQQLHGFQTIIHQTGLCVVGGGLAGVCAAISAARQGTKVVLMQDRPMLGGNASSEIRMWISGAHGKNMRETGLIEEMALENQYRNPDKNAYLWDNVVYCIAKAEKNLEILLNCACLDAVMKENHIVSVKGYQTTTQTWHVVEASIFADCSGDSVLAPLTGAAFRVGREAREEFGESIEPEKADLKTMGMSLSVCGREETRESTFIPPAWCDHYTKEDLIPDRVPSLQSVRDNMWYVELGGEDDSIADTETIRDQLIPIALGMWDYLKNAPENKKRNANWRLDWFGMLPGKRESRRYIGDYIMKQADVCSGGHFEDIVAYGGWTMDDHNPAGFRTREAPNIFHPAPSPYGIPYRSLYARDIDNLMFAGRNISVTHAAISSTRVLATCALLGQAVGYAADIAIKNGELPRDVYVSHMKELQQTLMENDCYLPWKCREIPALTREAELKTSAEGAQNLTNGIDRPVGNEDNGCFLKKGQSVSLCFKEEKSVGMMRLVFDSNLDRDRVPEGKRDLTKNIIHNRPLDWEDSFVPPTMVKAFRIEGVKENGEKHLLAEEKNNYFRLRHMSLHGSYKEIIFTPIDTWGDELCHVFSLDAR